MPRYIPPPPSADAELLTIVETAGLLRIARTGVDTLKREDPTFPVPILITPGAPRFRRSELQAWIDAKPRGWSTIGAHNHVRYTKAAEVR